jgi:hypothetical protein
MPMAKLRPGAIIAVLTGHAALFVALTATRVTLTPTTESETSTFLFMVPSGEIARAPPRATAPQPLPAPRVRPRAPRGERPAPAEQEGNTAPIAVDWAAEAAHAAARQIDANEEAARKAAAFSAHTRTPGSLRPPAPAKPQFGWSHASTHRVEELQEGGFIVNLSDRCAIVFAIMLIPACKLGRLEPRGDLLQHMNDSQVMGAEAADLP